MTSVPELKLQGSSLKRTLLKFALLIITSILALASLVMPIAMRPSSYPLQVGDVSPQDILSPSALNYESDILTQAARQDATAKVAPIYLPADPNITRHQIERFTVALNYISTVRLDSYATLQQKLSDFKAMTDMQLSEDSAERILSLNDYRWQLIQQEATNVIEQVMRNTIREDAVDQAQRSVPTLVSFTMPQDQASIVVDLVNPFIVANSLYSPDQTNTARLQAQQAVSPVTLSFAAGQTIVLRGQIITPVNMETLQKFGLVQPKNRNLDIFAATALVLLIAFVIILYFYRHQLPPGNDLRGLALIAVTFLVFLFGARFLIPNRAVVPYLFPIPAFGLTIAALYNMEIGLVFSLILSILAAHGLSNSMDLTLFYILTSFSGVLVLGKARRIASFFWAGIAIGVAGFGIILVYHLPDPITDWIGIATLAGAAFFNGIASSSLTLLFQFLFSQFLGLTTALQLLEISRPDHPLLQFILRNAPGTYQHSLQVANLAEQAAERIGADALLVRVGAIYHDSGKSSNPGFFIENQIPGKINPHDDLDPVTSAVIILQHITDGILVAKKYRLPFRIQNFISEHHGTLLTRYQYTRAVEAAGNRPELVDQELFRYPGPRPQSRETALLMLADGVEARARTELPKDEADIRALVKRVIDYLQKEGQLDDTRLTLQDLSIIVDSFCSTLRNTYHPRIQYPELKNVSVQTETSEKAALPVSKPSTEPAPPSMPLPTPEQRT
jgi:putative nucleotidyltransferase with HDIG domain